MIYDPEQIRNPKSEIRNSSPLTDSPWFWVLLFSAVALAALVAIHGKYSRRQAGMEIKYQARERLADDRVGDAESRPMSQPENTLIPLWPVAVVLIIVLLVATVMLMKCRSSKTHYRSG